MDIPIDEDGPKLKNAFLGTFYFKCPYCGWKFEDRKTSDFSDNDSRVRLDIETSVLHLIKEHQDLSSAYIANLKVWWDKAFKGVPFYGYFYSYAQYVRSVTREKLRKQGEIGKRTKPRAIKKPRSLMRYKRYLKKFAPDVLACYDNADKIPTPDQSFEMAKCEVNFLVNDHICNKASALLRDVPFSAEITHNNIGANMKKKSWPLDPNTGVKASIGAVRAAAKTLTPVPVFPAIIYEKNEYLCFASNWKDSAVSPRVVPQVIKTKNGSVVQYNFILDIEYSSLTDPFTIISEGGLLKFTTPMLRRNSWNGKQEEEKPD